MFHPLIEDLTKLKDQDLETKIADLSKKYHLALKFGQGGAAHQITLLLDSIKAEKQRRQFEAAQKNKEQTQQFNDLIKIS
jgi:hypothetical protein